MIELKLTGKITFIGEDVKVNETLSKREFSIINVAHKDGKDYENQFAFQAVNGRMRMLDNVKVGDRVDVFFNVRSSRNKNEESTNKFYTNLLAYKIDRHES